MEQLSRELDPFGFTDIEGAVNSPAEANRLLYIIGKLTGEMESINEECQQVLEETSKFYKKRYDGKQGAIDFLSSKVEAYVRATETNLSLPNGKALVKNMTEKEWLVDEQGLIEYAKVNAIEGGVTVKQVEKPNKKAIEQWLGDSESSVLKRTPVKKFYINLPKEKEDE